MNALEILEKARELISSERDWCIGEQTAREAEGDETRVQHCAVGALRNVGNGNYIKDASDALRAVLPVGWSIFRWNDIKGHACTLAAFDAAIEREKQK